MPALQTRDRCQEGVRSSRDAAAQGNPHLTCSARFRRIHLFVTTAFGDQREHPILVPNS
jgi:hypothetical protein